MVRYSFNPIDNFEEDLAKRSIAKEWDLGESSECEFDIIAPNTIHARPTWLPSCAKGYAIGSNYATLGQNIPVQEFHFGTIQIEAAQRLQVGSIFPDQITILVFYVFKNAKFYLPTDFRGNESHFLVTGTASPSRSINYYG